MRGLQRFVLLGVSLIILNGCGNVLYLSKLGWHQSFVTFHSVPIQEVLEDQRVDDLTKEKIRLIQEVKRYGATLSLGLSHCGQGDL